MNNTDKNRFYHCVLSTPSTNCMNEACFHNRQTGFMFCHHVHLHLYLSTSGTNLHYLQIAMTFTVILCSRGTVAMIATGGKIEQIMKISTRLVVRTQPICLRCAITWKTSCVIHKEYKLGVVAFFQLWELGEIWLIHTACFRKFVWHGSNLRDRVWLWFKRFTYQLHGHFSSHMKSKCQLTHMYSGGGAGNTS